MRISSKTVRSVFEIIALTICTLAFAAMVVGILGSLLGKDAAGTRDSVAYWSAGRLLAQHANPYDQATVLRLEQAVGLPLVCLPW